VLGERLRQDRLAVDLVAEVEIGLARPVQDQTRE
jgi:hypothetical protein